MANAFMGRFFKPGEEPRPSAGAGAEQPAPDAPQGVDSAVSSETDAKSAGKSGKSDMLAQRVDLHKYLLDKINLGFIDTMSSDELATEIRPIVREYIRDRHFPLSARELDLLIEDTTNEMLGLGPIEPLLKDDSIADILVNNHSQIFIERNGQLELTDIRFKDEDHLLRVINKIVSAVGRRVDESTPLVDARLADGSRVNVAIRPVAVDGPMVSIRKFSRHPLTMDRLVQSGSMADAMRILLVAAVQGRMSIVVSGGTGSGKTTLLNALSSKISDKERLITIEDAAELQLQQTHVCRMETKPPTLDGRNELRQRELLKNALRMRPDRIIVGEVRGEEAFDMLQAMNTGHEGSMCTVHANTPRDAISRLEQMVGMAGLPMTLMSIRGQIAAAIDLIVQVQRLHDGSRRVVSVSEITGMENDVIQMQEIMAFRKTGVNAENKIQGHFLATGIRPRFLETIAEVGLSVPDAIFDPSRPIS
ncbi:CpaF family protein [Roseibium salinum]|uniref:CpaF family protein n=1 Tax=Roseibium salinum TaxID=1604349 RepID=A0ABT3R912_9HYPH|nr:CpaF family protein [Roseibium sp. DSM 29163]MCX2725657.1 CpaF family protein [Roseibium sp. DSM 29163]